MMTDQPFCEVVDASSAIETASSGSIPSQVKPKTIKLGVHRFPILDVQH